MRKTKDQHFVNCPICKTENDVSVPVYLLMNAPNESYKGTHCKKCNSAITVVITMSQGLQALENLILTHPQKTERDE